jgi:MHS family proline/betaine transporter-like MFS transporter
MNANPSTIDTTEAAPVEKISPRIVLAGAIGSVVEYFDFAVYGYVATILAVHFFASGDPITALLATLATFAVAFVLRPVGALIFGHFGDRYGRKNALAATIILMAIASGMIGILPTYAAIGVGATALLVLARCMQGLAAGGELGGAASFVAEHSPNKSRGLMCSTTQMGALAGSLLASVTVTILNFSLGSEAMSEWGWRVPFLIAVPLGVVGLWIRNRLSESDEFTSVKKNTKTKKTPVIVLFREHPIMLLRVVGLSILLFSVYYVAYVYVNIHLQTVVGLDANFAYMSTTLTLIVSVIAMPMFGALSDRVGRKPVFIWATIAALVLAVPCFMLFEQGGAIAIIAHIVLGLTDSALMGVAMATFAEMFPTSIRYTGIAFGFSVGAALAGGTAPFICTWLVAVTGNPIAPAFFLIGTAIITLVAAISLKETKGIDLARI